MSLEFVIVPDQVFVGLLDSVNSFVLSVVEAESSNARTDKKVPLLSRRIEAESARRVAEVHIMNHFSRICHSS